MLEKNESVQHYYVEEIKKNIRRKRVKERIEKKRILDKSTLKIPSSQVKSKKVDALHKDKPVQKKVEVVVFKTNKTASTDKTQKHTSISKNDNFISKKILKDLQWDVTSFSLEGFSKEEQRKLEQERAIKLGAKPKKRDYLNYKVLMEQRKQEKLANVEQGKSSKKKSRSKRSKTNTVFWTESKSTKKFGQVGKYSKGVLSLSRRDIKSFK